MSTEEQELRELDAWIAEHVFNRPNDSYYCSVCRECVRTDTVTSGGYHQKCGGKVSAGYPFYSTNPADSFAVLEKCAKKIEESKMETDCVQIQWYDGQWNVCAFEGDIPTVSAKTLPLAIALFAKKLFEG